MSLIPEFIFQTTIVRGLATLREDSRYIDQLFRNLSQGDQQQMRAFIKSNQVDLVMNYPRSALSLPAIVLLLRSDNEHQQGAYLDDFMGIGTPEEFAYDSGIDGEILGGTATTSTMSGTGPIEFGPHRVLSATLNTIRVSDRTFYHSQFMDGAERAIVSIVAGTGEGQQREVVANSHNTLMVGENWTTVPDATSVFEVRDKASEVLGQPSKLYDRRGNEMIERKGGLYTNRYQAQLVASNQEQVIYLYAILKAIFTLSRIFMEGQGIINFRMSGTDFVNRPEYIPDFAYMRMLSIEFESPFDVYAPVGGLVENFNMCLIEGYQGANAEVSEVSVDLTPDSPSVSGP